MPLEQALAAILNAGGRFGEVRIQKLGGGFALCHRDDENRRDLKTLRTVEDAVEIARYDDAGDYRPLKTAPNLQHGWQLDIVDLRELVRALDYFYPGRLAILAAWKENRLSETSLRETLDRQSGMYRVAAKISDDQIDDVVGTTCRSKGGCLRTILWRRDKGGAIPSTKLPPEKFDPAHEQAARDEQSIPLLCQEACTILINACRKAVKGEADK